MIHGYRVHVKSIRSTSEQAAGKSQEKQISRLLGMTKKIVFGGMTEVMPSRDLCVLYGETSTTEGHRGSAGFAGSLLLLYFSYAGNPGVGAEFLVVAEGLLVFHLETLQHGHTCVDFKA
jgi:hypothetical protein